MQPKQLGGGGVTFQTKHLLGGAGALLALFLAIYFASPLFAFGALKGALQAGDRDRLEQLIDFPSVKDGLKQDLNAAMMEQLTNDPEMKDNPFAGLGMALAPMMVDRMVDAMVTPAGLAKATHTDKGDAADRGVGKPGPKARFKYAYVGLDRFKVSNSDTPEETAALVMERRGLFHWKLVRLQLPASTFEKTPASSTGDPAPVAATQPDYDPASAPLPALGECAEVGVSEVGYRLEDTPDSGSMITYDNGVYQVSYQPVPGIESSRVGDRVRLCVSELPKDCPAGDNRGVVYHATNLRTGGSWEEANSSHMCGGA